MITYKMIDIIIILILVIITDKSVCYPKFFEKRRFRDSLFPINNRREWYESRHHSKVIQKLKPNSISIIMGDIKLTIESINSNKIELKNCGVSDKVSTRIINGQYANAGEYPWIVSFEVNNRIMGCAGTILNERWIISAAHCFKRRNGTEIKLIPASAVSVKVGSNDIAEGIKYYVTKIIIHDQFDVDLMMNTDIALIKTQTDILKKKQGNIDLINNICLPKSKEEEPLSKSLEVIGWGKLNPKDEYGSQSLMKASIPLISDKMCNSFYRWLKFDDAPNGLKIYNSQICALSKSKDACQGDSGGPAFEFVNDRAVLIGIVSFGYGCGDGYPGVYTQVSYFLDWIAENMN